MELLLYRRVQVGKIIIFIHFVSSIPFCNLRTMRWTAIFTASGLFPNTAPTSLNDKPAA